jgi:hypothetical protein
MIMSFLSIVTTTMKKSQDFLTILFILFMLFRLRRRQKYFFPFKNHNEKQKEDQFCFRIDRKNDIKDQRKIRILFGNELNV